MTMKWSFCVQLSVHLCLGKSICHLALPLNSMWMIQDIHSLPPHATEEGLILRLRLVLAPRRIKNNGNHGKRSLRDEASSVTRLGKMRKNANRLEMQTIMDSHPLMSPEEMNLARLTDQQMFNPSITLLRGTSDVQWSCNTNEDTLLMASKITEM